MQKRRRILITTLIIFTLVLTILPNQTLAANNRSEAVKRSNEYLETLVFSRMGLIEQLEYEGFSHEDAVYGVDATGTDWKEQAFRKAKEQVEYQEISREGLIEVLEFLKFTPEEAIYGSDKALGNMGPVGKFKDLENHIWAKEAIETMAEEGIINGISEDEFDPSSNIKRGDFVVLIARLLELDGGDIQALPFEDVDGDKYYATSIAAVYEKGLINGRTETSFDPEGFISRQEMSVILGNIISGRSEVTIDRDLLDRFADRIEISSWALDGVSIVVDHKIIEGSIEGNETLFKPEDNATRAEAALMLYRFKKNIL